VYQARTTPPRRPTPSAKPSKRKLYSTIAVIAVLLLIALGVFLGSKAFAPDTTSGTTSNTEQSASSLQFDKQQYSTTNSASIWVIVNKQNPLAPKEYAPNNLVFPDVPLRVPGNDSMQLRQDAATALEKLVAGAKSEGLTLMLASGYRSYTYQVGLYDGYVRSMGKTEADKTSARPGHSEHQTGLAADLEPVSKECELEICFGDLPEGKWLAANAYRYGFIIRYPIDKTSITGYEYEPWHLRYIGTGLAAELKKQNLKTLEEFFDVAGGTSY